jgi:hypothetical protein
MEYKSAQETAKRWGVSKRRVLTLCNENRIHNAKKIGNMWIIPDNVLKPKDERKKKNVINKKNKDLSILNGAREARNQIKRITIETYKKIVNEVDSPYNAKIYVMQIFGEKLLCHYFNEIELVRKTIIDIFGMEYPIKYVSFSRDFEQFIENYNEYIDDAYAWAYQFLNKQSRDTGFEDTQFFTEKYMIHALVNNVSLQDFDGDIVDPACGGGNFLIFILDSLVREEKSGGTKEACINNINLILKRIIGYEIDPVLAIIASINLKLKSLSILKIKNYNINIYDFYIFETHIYTSVNSNFIGSLEFLFNEHCVINVNDRTIKYMDEIFSNVDLVFTNPPFQTIKGMGMQLKEFLKKNYPLVKCDVCNAFIQLCAAILNKNGICNLVTQNSWLYLDSFNEFREKILSTYRVKMIIELGTNAFYDINGEKTNVILLQLSKSMPTESSCFQAYNLKRVSYKEIESCLSDYQKMAQYNLSFMQKEMLENGNSSFNMIDSDKLKSIQKSEHKYGASASPMQGTSTGDSKRLVDYFWKHLEDPSWKLVSKGGGYSRWNGLNHYCVHWGKDGEVVKKTKGSVVRNEKYFSQTRMVFSDTGTAGLNVRKIRKQQIFIASGPGIRFLDGDEFAHMGCLNSRWSTFWIKATTPKLTIAAGYISKIPISKSLLESSEISIYAKKCYQLKTKRLSMVPINIEYTPLTPDLKGLSLEERAENFFLDSLKMELLQLIYENIIDEIIFDFYNLSGYEREVINSLIGFAVFENKQRKAKILSNEMDNYISNYLTINCMLSRTSPNKNIRGCDGILEYLAQDLEIDPKDLYKNISNNIKEYPLLNKKIKAVYLHLLVLTALEYSPTIKTSYKNICIKDILDRIVRTYPSLVYDIDQIQLWITTNFNQFHQKAFLENPLYTYDESKKQINLMEYL